MSDSLRELIANFHRDSCYPEAMDHELDAIVAALSAPQADAEEGLSMLDTMYEITNRASNFADADAAEWMPSIYSLACKAVGQDPEPLLRATGFDGEINTWPTRAASPSQPQAEGSKIGPQFDLSNDEPETIYDSDDDPSDHALSCADEGTKSEGGVEGHAETASSRYGKPIAITCLKSETAGIKPGPSEPTPPDQLEAIAQAWQSLLDKDDRTSPEEYPDMALITFDEFQDAILALLRGGE